MKRFLVIAGTLWLSAGGFAQTRPTYHGSATLPQILAALDGEIQSIEDTLRLGEEGPEGLKAQLLNDLKRYHSEAAAARTADSTLQGQFLVQSVDAVTLNFRMWLLSNHHVGAGSLERLSLLSHQLQSYFVASVSGRSQPIVDLQ